MLTISTNVPSITAQRTLQKNSEALSASFQRLSTGLRINSAKDDSAGLAISNRLSAQIRGLNQAVRNASDAASMVQTAEAALNEQQGMLQRLRELAVQAASDTYTAGDRAAIQLEVNALVSEIDRIAVQTQFNGRALLDGTLSDAKFQVGANESQTVALTVRSARNFNLGAVYSGTAVVDVAASFSAAGDLTINGVAIRSTVNNTDDTVSVSAQRANSAIAKAAAINAASSSTGVTAEVGSAVVTGSTAIVATTAATLTINGVATTAVTTLANDSDSALRNAVNAISSQTGVTATLDASNQLVLTAADGRTITLGAVTNVAGHTAASTAGRITLKSDSTISLGGTVGASLVGSPTLALRSVNVSTLDLSSQAGATTAIDVIDDAIAQVSGRQAQLGAVLNRMDAAVSQLAAASENISAARGRIQDADFAMETAVFSKNQILQQTATAMLAQANVSGQIALQLIG